MIDFIMTFHNMYSTLWSSSVPCFTLLLSPTFPNCTSKSSYCFHIVFLFSLITIVNIYTYKYDSINLPSQFSIAYMHVLSVDHLGLDNISGAHPWGRWILSLSSHSLSIALNLVVGLYKTSLFLIGVLTLLLWTRFYLGYYIAEI